MKTTEKIVITALLLCSTALTQNTLGAETAAIAAPRQLTEPPEQRINMPSREMPEHVMSRKTSKDIEDERNAPVRDAAGNIQYIISVTNSATQRYAGTASRGVAPDMRFANWHAPEMVQVLHGLEWGHGFSATHLYSQTMNGFAAFLSESQAASLRKDERIRDVEPSRKLEFSGGLWVDYTSSNEILPWGIQAVGGGKFSNYGATVYLVDSGVGYHPDINVVDRWAVSGALLVGQYAHSTHAAGIIGGVRGNSTGIVGVNSSTKIVSLAVGDGVFKAAGSADVVAAFEETKRRIKQSNKVGVVNLSMNKQSIFDNRIQGNALVSSIRNLILPDAVTGYRGAIFIQSAGNQEEDACNYAFNDRLPGDGALVVGAIDYNGQPIRKLNGSNRIVNSFNTEPGSNYGSCVDAWAPGNKIYSTWFNNGSTSPTYSVLSGTSMAAPHVAGIAAWLIESRPWLQTPADVEGAVRSLLYAGGATDKSGFQIRMPNLDGVQLSAKPTVEFDISNNYGESPNIAQYYANSSFTLRYDSTGASACSLRGWINGAPWYEIPNFQTSYNWGSIVLSPGQYRWEAACNAPSGTSNVATASINIVAAPAVPTVSFHVDGVAVADGAVISRHYGQSFNFSYSSTNAASCDLTAELDYYPFDFPQPWYAVSNFYTAYNWGSVSLDRGRYSWNVVCRNNAGDSVSANVKASID